MKKKLLCALAVLVFMFQPFNLALAKSKSHSNGLSPTMRIAIKKYRHGNYTGCLQTCQSLVSKQPTNACAYYYMAMAYVQAGKKNSALQYYSKVLSLKTNPKIKEYATTGKRCLETPDKCVLAPVQSVKENLSDIDRFIASPASDGLSKDVRSDFDKKRLDEIKNQINQGNQMDDYSFRKINYSSPNDSAVESLDKIAQTKPTDAEVQAAMKVLNDAGMSTTSMNPMAASSANSQNAELMQLNAMMGGNQSGNSNNDAMMNMLPYMIMQGKNGTSNYSPQLMQSVIMSSMMNSYNYNVDENK